MSKCQFDRSKHDIMYLVKKYVELMDEVVNVGFSSNTAQIRSILTDHYNKMYLAADVAYSRVCKMCNTNIYRTNCELQYYATDVAKTAGQVLDCIRPLANHDKVARSNSVEFEINATSAKSTIDELTERTLVSCGLSSDDDYYRED